MKIELIRLCENNHSIESLLLLNGTKRCDATEDKIASLPVGTYPVVLHPCPRIGGVVPLICAEETEETPVAPNPANAAAAGCSESPANAARTATGCSESPANAARTATGTAAGCRESPASAAAAGCRESPASAAAASPIVPTPAMCCRCKALADERQAIVEDEISALQDAMAKGMHGRPLQRYERQLDKQRRMACAKQRLPVCPRLSRGGGIFGDTGGAILLGTYQLPGILTRSREAYARLLFALRYATKKGDPISLTISNLRSGPNPKGSLKP